MARINYNGWFFDQFKYKNHGPNFKADYTDTKWANISNRLRNLIDTESTLLEDQLGVVANNRGFDHLIDLMGRSNYTFEDVNKGLIDTYHTSLKNAMGRMLVNTQSVIFATDALDTRNVTSENFTHYYIVDAPFKQLHFGGRDEFIRQHIGHMWGRGIDRWMSIQEFIQQFDFRIRTPHDQTNGEPNGPSEILPFTILPTVNGYICNDVHVAVTANGLRFRIGWPYAADAKFILYKLDHAEMVEYTVDVEHIQRGRIPWEQLPGIQKRIDTHNRKCMINIYDPNFLKSAPSCPNFGEFDDEGFNILHLQTKTRNDFDRKWTEKCVCVIYIFKYFHEVPNIYPAANYMELVEQRPVFHNNGERIVDLDRNKIVSDIESAAAKMDICTPPIVLDRSSNHSFQTFIDVMGLRDLLLLHAEKFQKIGAVLQSNFDAFTLQEDVIQVLRGFINEDKETYPENGLYSDMVIAYEILVRGGLLTNQVSAETLESFENLLETLDGLQKSDINNADMYLHNIFYTNGGYQTWVDEITRPFRTHRLRAFHNIHSMISNYFKCEEGNYHRFNRPISEQCFITLKWDPIEEAWLFANPKIKHFKGLGNTFYIEDDLTGNEIFKFFVLYTDTENPRNFFVDPLKAETVFNFDEFYHHVDRHVGYIRYWNMENRLLKLSKILFNRYDDETVVQVISRMIKRRIHGEDFMDIYPSDMNYEASAITTNNTYHYDIESEQAPFAVNFLFWTLQMIHGDNDNIDKLQTYFFHRLTMDKYQQRYTDFPVHRIMNPAQVKYHIEPSGFSLGPLSIAPNSIEDDSNLPPFILPENFDDLVMTRAIENWDRRRIEGGRDIFNFRSWEEYIEENPDPVYTMDQLPFVSWEMYLERHPTVKDNRFLAEATVFYSQHNLAFYGLPFITDKDGKVLINTYRYTFNTYAKDVEHWALERNSISDTYYAKINPIGMGDWQEFNFFNEVGCSRLFSFYLTALYAMIAELQLYYTRPFNQITRVESHIKNLEWEINRIKEWDTDLAFHHPRGRTTLNEIIDSPFIPHLQRIRDCMFTASTYPIGSNTKPIIPLFNVLITRLEHIFKNFGFVDHASPRVKRFYMHLCEVNNVIMNPFRYMKWLEEFDEDTFKQLDSLIAKNDSYDSDEYLQCEPVLRRKNPNGEYVSIYGDLWAVWEIYKPRAMSALGELHTALKALTLPPLQTHIDNVTRFVSEVVGDYIFDMYSLDIDFLWNSMNWAQVLKNNFWDTEPFLFMLEIHPEERNKHFYPPLQLFDGQPNPMHSQIIRLIFQPMVEEIDGLFRINGLSNIMEYTFFDDTDIKVNAAIVDRQGRFLQVLPFVNLKFRHIGSTGGPPGDDFYQVVNNEYVTADFENIHQKLTQKRPRYLTLFHETIIDEYKNALNLPLGACTIFGHANLSIEETYEMTIGHVTVTMTTHTDSNEITPIILSPLAPQVITRDIFLSRSLRVVTDEHPDFVYAYFLDTGNIGIRAGLRVTRLTYEWLIEENPLQHQAHEEHAKMNYELYFGNNFFPLNHTNQMINDERGKLPGPIDRVQFHTQQINTLINKELSRSRPPQMFFKPTHIFHRPRQSDGSIRSVGSKYFVGQTLFLCSDDDLCVFPIRVTAVDHNISNGFIEAIVDPMAPWFEMDEDVAVRYVRQNIRCHIIDDNLSNFLCEFSNGDFMNFSNVLFNRFVNDDPTDKRGTKSLPGDPIFVQNNGLYAYHRLKQLFPDEIHNGIRENNPERRRMIYMGNFDTDDRNNVIVNMINHNFTDMSDTEIYPILREEPNDHHIWEAEVYEFTKQRNEAAEQLETYRLEIQSIVSQLSQINKTEERIPMETQLKRTHQAYTEKKEFIQRMQSYIDHLEPPTTWYNTRAYEDTLVYINNGRGVNRPSFIPNIRNIPYHNGINVFIYDWDHKRWLAPSEYNVTFAFENGVRLQRYDDYTINQVLHRVQINCGNIESRSLLVYFSYESNKAFDSVQQNPNHCDVRFSPVLSIPPNRVIGNPYDDLKIRQHYDAREEFFFPEGYNSPNNFSIEKAYHFNRPIRSGTYTGAGILRFCDLSVQTRSGVRMIDAGSEPLPGRAAIIWYPFTNINPIEPFAQWTPMGEEPPEAQFQWNVPQITTGEISPVKFIPNPDGFNILRRPVDYTDFDLYVRLPFRGSTFTPSVEPPPVRDPAVIWQPLPDVIAREPFVRWTPMGEKPPEDAPLVWNKIGRSIFNTTGGIRMGDIRTRRQFSRKDFTVDIRQPIDTFYGNEIIQLITMHSSSGNVDVKYDGNMSNVMFECETSHLINGVPVLKIIDSTLRNNDRGDFICTVLQSGKHRMSGGVIHVKVVNILEDVVDRFWQWVRVPDEFATYRELPNEFILVPKVPDEFDETDMRFHFKTQYNRIFDTRREIDVNNNNLWNPYEFYMHDRFKVRLPISRMQTSNHRQRLVVDRRENPEVVIYKTPYLGVCRYSQQEIPQDGYINLTGYLPTPLSRERYEFWVNGRFLRDEVIILSPTTILLRNLTSLRNFEVIELVEDMHNNAISPKGIMYVGMDGNVYSSYETALRSKSNIMDMNLRFRFNANQHDHVHDYHKTFVVDTNNYNLEPNILNTYVIPDEDRYEYRQRYNPPSINGVPLGHPKLTTLGIFDTPNMVILDKFDEVWKKEILTDPFFPITHKEGYDLFMDRTLSLVVHAGDFKQRGFDVPRNTMVISTQGVYDGFFSLYVSETHNGEIWHPSTVKIIPFIRSGVYVLLSNRYRNMWLHSTAPNCKSIQLR
jgi:hypothetical protein